MKKEPTSWTYDDITTITREAFEAAFKYERDYRPWAEVVLADETSSAKELKKALANFRLEISHRMNVQLTEEDTQDAKTKIDLSRTVQAAIRRAKE